MVCIYRYIHICKYAWLYSTSGRDLRLNPHHFLQTQPGEMMDFSLRQWCEVLALGWWSHSAAHFFANLKGDCPSVGGCSSFRFDFDDFFHFFFPHFNVWLKEVQWLAGKVLRWSHVEVAHVTAPGISWRAPSHTAATTMEALFLQLWTLRTGIMNWAMPGGHLKRTVGRWLRYVKMLGS